MSKINLIAILLALVLFSCKKEKKQAPPQPASTSSQPATLTVTTIPEQIGYVKVFNVIERGITTPIPNGTPVTQTISTFTSTFSIVADTLLPNNITGKKYVITDNSAFPSVVYAYSYFNSSDSIWYFRPLNYSYYVHDICLKLPLTANQTWSFTVASCGDNLNNVGQTSIPVSSMYSTCYCIQGNCNVVVNFQTYNYKYYVYTKGIAKYIYGDFYFSNPASTYTSEKELNLISTNF